MKLLYSLQFYFNNRILNHFPSNKVRMFFLRLQGMKIGKQTIIYDGFEIRHPKKIEIGDNCIIGFKATLDGRRGLIIGNNVNLSSEVMIWTEQHDYNDSEFGTVGGAVIIEDYAWLSVRSVILPSTVIKKGAVVAGCALVNHDVPPYTVVGGIPAKKISERISNLNYKFTDEGHLYFL